MDIRNAKPKSKPGKNAKVAVLDFETDPFKYGRDPKPFAGCLYAPELGHLTLWGPDCVAKIIAIIRNLPGEWIIYAHNGGRFDFFFLYSSLENPLLIINSRIVEARIGQHFLRDSFAILPVPLASFEKGKIDYSHMESGVREQHKQEIITYLESDCTNLYELVSKFVAQFGPKITIGSTALSRLQKIHPQRFIRDPEKAEEHDIRFRDFYYGGRVQAFEGGVIRGRFKVFDVNSMYPAVMKNYMHPHGANYIEPQSVSFDVSGNLRGFTVSPFFIDFEGGATHLPFKERDGTLSFTRREGRFTVTGHEFKVAYAAGFVRVDKVNRVIVAQGRQSFGEFVDACMTEKIDAEKRGDKAGRLFAKLLANSSYGKFATNPRKFKEYHIETLGEWNHPEGAGWEVTENNGHFRLWARAVPTDKGWKDVAIAASITGAARAEMLKAILNAKRPLYCDTDSLICANVKGIRIDPLEIGAWKSEAEGDLVAIAGKKLYCVTLKGEPVKWASKGAVLTPAEIIKIASGGTVSYRRDAPSYDVAGNTRFLVREIRSTLDKTKKRP